MRLSALRSLLLTATLLLAGCEKSGGPSPAPPNPTAATAGSAPGAGDAKKGKATYFSSCISCHNINPKLPGSVGPEVAGASRELLEARLLRAEYPAGYAPKRNTKLMAALPHLADRVDDLAAYLAAP